MPKAAKELSAVQIPRLSAGLHAVGGVSGLYLKVSDGGARNWILRVMVGGRRRDMGLGGWPSTTLAQARDQAREARRCIASGTDPIEERRKKKRLLISKPTFADCARRTIEAKRHGWKNEKHAAQWTTTLEAYAFPLIGRIPVDEVELRHVIEILTPLWSEKTETATRVRSRIEAVLGWATASGYRQGDNPARWRGNLDALLAKPSKVKKVNHHRAIPVADAPGFIARLRRQAGVASLALEFLILTAARSGEVRGAIWDEFDLENRVWTIPASRMKTAKQHRVPLSPAAIRILSALPRTAGVPHVFHGPRSRPLSDMSLSAVMRRMGADGVPHGLRSTFRDWAAEKTSYSSEVIEMALAHAIPNRVEAAYRRGDLFTKRLSLMADWADYLGPPLVTTSGTAAP